MPALPAEITVSKTVQAIYATYEKAAESEGRRRYIGASIIGKPCSRAIWYDFHWSGTTTFSGRLLRLFQTGHLAEPRFVADLRAIGCEVHEVDPATGKQFAVTALAGHFAGHMDGVVLGIPEAPKTWHLLEMKTHSHKSFTGVRNSGVKHAKPEHYAQVQIYMHLSDGLDRALYLAVNKDTEELYAERIHYDKSEALAILAKAESIIKAAGPPAKISDNPDKFPCSFCDHKFRCHGSENTAVPVEVNCRTCIHSTADLTGAWNHGAWTCARHGGKLLSEAEQKSGCEDHLFNPSFIQDGLKAELLDAQDDWIEYQIGRAEDGEDESIFRNGKSKDCYRSIELTQCPPQSPSDPLIQAAKEIGAVIVSNDAPLFAGQQTAKPSRSALSPTKTSR